MGAAYAFLCGCLSGLPYVVHGCAPFLGSMEKQSAIGFNLRMKTFQRVISFSKAVARALFCAGVLAVILIFSSFRASAIEGLTISIQDGTNVVLGWPSATNETYLIQTISAFGPTNSWLVLTDNYPACVGMNWTTYVLTNANPTPSGGGGGGSGGGGSSPPSPEDARPDSSISAVELAPGETEVPPSPWIPATLPRGAILKASGEYVALPALGSYEDAATPDGVTPDDSTNGITQSPFFQVVRDGAHIYGLTNNEVLSGQVQFPIEYAVDSADTITGVAFYDQNNSPIAGTEGVGTNNQWNLVWNTTMLPSGTYTINVEIDYAIDQPATSLPVTVVVSNVITFPNYLTELFGSQLWVFAQTLPNAAYSLDIYDESNTYVGTFEDYSDTNGYISFIWNLVDPSGATNYSTNFSGVFTVDTSSLSGDSMIKGNTSFALSTNAAIAQKSPVKLNGVHPDGGSSSSASAKTYWTQEVAWKANDTTWVVACGPFSGSTSQQNADTFMIAGGVDEDDPYHGVLGTLASCTFSPGNVANAGEVFFLADATTRSNLLSYLASSNYDNFYFFGHGSASAIGAYNGTALSQGDIATALFNVPLSYVNPHLSHTPYRFVFIDGCDTGSGNFCESFSIPAAALSTNYFATAGIESRVFVGFTSWKVNLNIYNWEEYSDMTHELLNDWLRGVPIQTCVNNAKSDSHDTGASLDSSAVVYGATDLQHGVHTP
jgi:hypothetical protein